MEKCGNCKYVGTMATVTLNGEVEQSMKVPWYAGLIRQCISLTIALGLQSLVRSGLSRLFMLMNGAASTSQVNNAKYRSQILGAISLSASSLTISRHTWRWTGNRAAFRCEFSCAVLSK